MIRERVLVTHRHVRLNAINMQIDLLAQILAVAVDHGRPVSNPAVGKRRRMKVSKRRPVHLDSAEQTAVLLEAAGDLDCGDNEIEVQNRHGKTWTQRPELQTIGRRAAFATLLLGGGRASATGAMLWRDINLANGRFEVGRDKTDAGMREVDMLPLLREILTGHKAASEKTGPDDPVFLTSTGTARSRHNLRQDVVEPVVNRANRLVEERGLQPLRLGITPHKLRHTFASILVAIGKDPTYVMQQLGHKPRGVCRSRAPEWPARSVADGASSDRAWVAGFVPYEYASPLPLRGWVYAPHARLTPTQGPGPSRAFSPVGS
jgi:integrase